MPRASFATSLILAVVVAAIAAIWWFDDSTVRKAKLNSAASASNSAELSQNSEPQDSITPIDSEVQSVNPAFRFLTEEERNQVEPAVQFQYFSGPDNSGYIRHTVVNIDTAEFQRQLRQAWVTAEELGEDSFVNVPVFDDQTITISADSWIGHPSGHTGVFGSAIVDGIEIAEGMRVYFSPDGDMDLTVTSNEKNYRLASVRDFRTYVAIGTKPIARID